MMTVLMFFPFDNVLCSIGEIENDVRERYIKNELGVISHVAPTTVISVG